MTDTRQGGFGIAGSDPSRMQSTSRQVPHPRVIVVGGALALAACAAQPPLPAPVVPPPLVPPVAHPVARAAQGLAVDDPANRCASMVYRSLPGTKVVRAEFMAVGPALAADASTHRTAGDALPEHCRIEGRIAAGSDGVDGAPSIAFEIRLPSRWNGRFFYQGSRDSQRQLVEAYGRNTGAGGFEDSGLSHGYAVLSSDAGRTRAAASAAGLPHGLAADDALERAASAGRAVVRTYYGKLPDRSYFVGCSEGGVEGLLFAQRWPHLFDGIVAVAPLLRETDAAVAAAWTLQRFDAVAPRTRDRQPDLSRAFGTEDLFTVAQAILKQCDALDGAEDGFVMDMAGCRVDLQALQCPNARSKACLSPRQVAALGQAMAGPRDPAGRPLYVPWPWDPGLAAPGWRTWTLGGTGPRGTADARHRGRIAAALGAGFAGAPGAKSGVPGFDIGRDLARHQAARDADSAFFDASLEAFRQRRGKLLLVHGAADPVVSAWATVDYQRRLSQAPVDPDAPGDAEVARTFIVPGMNHCMGGPATDRFDALAAVVDWVELDRAPQRIEARGSAVLASETRPLCPWPQVARYRGIGNVHESASFECR